jgi:hypothetical protein
MQPALFFYKRGAATAAGPRAWQAEQSQQGGRLGWGWEAGLTSFAALCTMACAAKTMPPTARLESVLAIFSFSMAA